MTKGYNLRDKASHHGKGGNETERAKGVKVMRIGENKAPHAIPTHAPMGVQGTTRGSSKPA